MRCLTLIFAASIAAGCGTKGALTLPPKSQPAASHPAQPAPAPTSPADDSKARSGAKQ